MKNIAFLAFVAAAALLSADCDHSTGSQTSYHIPVGRVILSPETQSECIAYSLLAEGGVRTWRANGTVGGWITEQSRLKASFEWLSQKLAYGYSTGKEFAWVNQLAVGADYEYLFDDCNFIKALDLKGYYSHAPSRYLGTQNCIDEGDNTVPVARNIAGSDAYGGSLGAVSLLGDCHRFDVTLDYDHVRYRRRFDDHKTVSGLGGGITWTARLPCCVDLSLIAQFKRPYNYYGARLAVPGFTGLEHLSLAFFGGVTRGKSHLPNNVTAGIEVTLPFSPCEGFICKTFCCRPLWNPCDLNHWVKTPAVYMPEVLAIADECRSFDINNFPADVFVFWGDSYSINSSEILGVTPGPGIVFSATGLPDSASFDPANGLITGDNFIPPGLSEVYNITVTVTNNCAQASSSFDLVLFPPTF